MAWLNRSMNKLRFGRSVSASWSAWWLSANRERSRSTTLDS